MKMFSLILITALSLCACKSATEDSSGENGKTQPKPDSSETGQKNNAIAARVYFEIKSLTAIAMTDEMLTLRISYSYNQGVVKAQQVMIPIKKGEAHGQDFTSWLGRNNGTQLEALVFRSRVEYAAGDMFGFAFVVKKPFDGSSERSSQAMVKAFISDEGTRPVLQLLKSKFEFPVKSELRTWLNE